MSDELNPPAPASSEAQVNPRAAEAAAVVFSELITNLGALRSGGQRANTAYIAFMDRIILLAGGTLTLIFTVLGSLSAHLYDTQLQARHVPFILLACWLLIVAIVGGLVYNSASIKLGGYLDTVSALTTADAQIKLKLVSLPFVTNIDRINALPPLAGAVDLKDKIKYSQRAALICGWIAQGALVSAFFFLVLFIQANVWIMLVNNPHK
jgi:hypothetical protein